jgi:hypothetical protein
MMLMSCVIGPAPFLPDNWKRHAPGLERVSEPQHTPQLQVLIMYSGLSSSHSALRLVENHEHVVVWDPAGDYARFEGGSVLEGEANAQPPRRMRDLIMRDPPPLDTYIQFRWSLDDTSVEVFEWDLSPIKAEHLRDILVKGTDESHPAGSFSTLTWPALCTVAMSDFLERFAKPILHISDWYLFPHNLSQELYRQAPDRVRIFTPGQEPLTFTAPSPQPRHDHVTANNFSHD